jgi:hypothetical protein
VKNSPNIILNITILGLDLIKQLLKIFWFTYHLLIRIN